MMYNPNGAIFSFSERVKDEIVSTDFSDDEALAFLCGYLQTGKFVRTRDEKVTFRIIAEREHRADFVISLLERFDVSCTSVSRMTDLRIGADKFTFWCRSGTDEFLERTGLDKERDVVPSLARSSKKRGVAYITGAFLAGGSVCVPTAEEKSRSGYHFEIAFPSQSLCESFCDFVGSFDILAKSLKRQTRFVMYVKSREVISDLLELMRCWDALEALEDLVVRKELSNNLNRAANCSVSNIDRSVKASVNMIRDIELIMSSSEAENLSDELREVCDAKMKNPDSSMSELAGELQISKSCLMHRMNKLSAIAANIRNGEAR